MPVTFRKPAPDFAQRLLSVKDTARYLGTSTWQIRKSWREGGFPKIRYGNRDTADRADLDAFIEKMKTTA